jgi:hypothetical protein
VSRDLRAPGADGAVVAEPPLAEVGALLEQNRQRRKGADPVLLGDFFWQEVRNRARREVAAAARGYLLARGEFAPEVAGRPHLLVAGHQPELFHPGVWAKNFALNGLARRHGLVPLNLVVDNDTAKATALRLPSPPTDEFPWPHAVTVPFDVWKGQVPWEDRGVVDGALFGSFADRAMRALRGWDYRPLLPEFWAEVRRQEAAGGNLGEGFAAARRTWERRWGCHNLEVPLSVVCRTDAFGEFAAHLLRDLPRFHRIYNEQVHAYRRRHDIKDRHHPVPDLEEQDGWLEAPFWGWRKGQERRGRVFARLESGRIALRAGREEWPALQVGGPGTTSASFRALHEGGFKLRSRALTTTLFARLLLADLFVHGIGGGKYDELTDELIRHFYGLEPPAFLILSATKLLPLTTFPRGPDDCRHLAREARDVHYNPQRHLPADLLPDLRPLLAEKQAWIERQSDDAAGRRQRFARLRELTAALRTPLEGHERELRAELDRCGHELEANAVLRRRDYSFCLYPEDGLRPFCTQFL